MIRLVFQFPEWAQWLSSYEQKRADTVAKKNGGTKMGKMGKNRLKMVKIAESGFFNYTILYNNYINICKKIRKIKPKIVEISAGQEKKCPPSVGKVANS